MHRAVLVTEVKTVRTPLMRIRGVLLHPIQIATCAWLAIAEINASSPPIASMLSVMGLTSSKIVPTHPMRTKPLLDEYHASSKKLLKRRLVQYINRMV